MTYICIKYVNVYDNEHEATGRFWNAGVILRFAKHSLEEFESL